MTTTSQALTQLNELIYNPPKQSNFVNQSFVDRIKAAENNLAGLVSERDRAYSASQQAQNDYNTFTGNMRGYNDYYQEAENEFGVAQAKDTYEKNKQAIAMTESMMEALPSSISARSARRLTQSQRNLAYNTQADTINKTRSQLSAGAKVYEQAWKNARENQAAKASAEVSAERAKQNTLQTAWMGALNQYNATAAKVLSGESELQAERRAYLDWQNRQSELAMAQWQTQVNAAQKRYEEALATAQVYNQYAIPEEKSYDFGNGYTLRGANGGEAQYYLNGQRISAGRFLEGTGANGANWNAWNNVWASGVNTRGVGSDTVEAFNQRSAVGERFNYLFTL